MLNKDDKNNNDKDVTERTFLDKVLFVLSMTIITPIVFIVMVIICKPMRVFWYANILYALAILEWTIPFGLFALWLLYRAITMEERASRKKQEEWFYKQELARVNQIRKEEGLEELKNQKEK